VGVEEVLMTKHRTITGFVAVALLAVAAAATMKSHTPWTKGIVVAAGPTSPQDVAVDANGTPAADFNDRWSALSASTPAEKTSP
jgi:hypothetical protein